VNGPSHAVLERRTEQIRRSLFLLDLEIYRGLLTAVALNFILNGLSFVPLIQASACMAARIAAVSRRGGSLHEIFGCDLFIDMSAHQRRCEDALRTEPVSGIAPIAIGTASIWNCVRQWAKAAPAHNNRAPNQDVGQNNMTGQSAPQAPQSESRRTAVGRAGKIV
jgi:hypothetical protein